MKKIIAIILMLSMLLALGACGNSAAASAEAPAAASGTEDAAPADAAPADAAPADDAAPAEGSASAAEAAAPVATVEYPLEGNPSFTMCCIARNNVLAVIGDDDFSITPAYQGLAEGTGCTIEFTMLGEATAEEKTNVMLASGDMSDLYTSLGWAYGNNLPAAIQDGVTFDFTPYLEECAPDYYATLQSDPDLMNGATNADGTICKFLSVTAKVISKGLVVRQDWMDDLGLELPTSREGLEDILAAFQSEKGAVWPILVNNGLESGLTGTFNVVYNGMRGMDYQLTEPDGNEAVACFASEGFIEYLVYMHHLFEKGLVTDDFMSIARENGNWESSYYGGKCGVWADGYRELDPANASNADDPNYAITPFALTDYECHVNSSSAVSMDGVVFITTCCEDIESCMKMMNYCYTEDGIINGLYGKGGCEISDSGEITLSEGITNNENGWTINNALTFYGGAQWMPTVVDTKYYELVCAPESYAGMQYWTENGGDGSMTMPSGVTLDADQSSEFNNLASDVLTLFTESAVKVITGDLDEAGYRKVIDDANGMGMARMTELYQAALDSYRAA